MVKLNFIAVLVCMITGTVFCQDRGAIVTIKITGFKTDSLLMADNDRPGKFWGKKDKDGRFVFQLKSGFPKIVNLMTNRPQKRISFYIEEGDRFNVITNMEDSAVFSGVGAANANLFFKNFGFMMKAWRAIDINENTTPNDLYNQYDAMFKTPMNNLENNKQAVTPTFYKLYYDWLYYQDLGYKMGVPQDYQQQKKSKKISECLPDNYWELLKLARLNDPVLEMEEYKSTMFGNFPGFLRNEYKVKLHPADSVYNTDEMTTYVYHRLEQLVGPEARPVLLSVALMDKLRRVKDTALVKPLMDTYMKMYGDLKDPGSLSYIKELQEEYGIAVAMSSGMEPPPFVVKDITGNEVSLKDFAGKVIYLDFWASWCAPCRVQMKQGAPTLHKMFEGNKNMVFLFINLDKTMEAAQKAIAEDKIEGVHLFAGDITSDNPVTNAFNVTEIPRYVIIGKNGKIIDADAPRPTDNLTQQLLIQALTWQ